MKKIKPSIGYAVILKFHHFKKGKIDGTENTYCFTWNKKHPEEKNQKSERVFAIYPSKRQAIADLRFRAGMDYGFVKKIIFK